MYTIHCVKRQYNLLPRILARSTLHYSGRICFLKILKNVPAGQCSLWKDHKAVFREFLPVARCIVWVGRVFLKNLKVHPLLYVTCTIHTNNHLSFFTNVKKNKKLTFEFLPVPRRIIRVGCVSTGGARCGCRGGYASNRAWCSRQYHRYAKYVKRGYTCELKS